MKKRLTIVISAAVLLFYGSANAQEIRKGNPGMYPSAINFKNAPPAFKKGTVLLADETGKLASVNSTAILSSTQKDQLGMRHYRYKQSFNGISVELSSYIVHVQNGKVISENGEWVKDFPAQLKSTAGLNKAVALKKATDFIGAKIYKWEVPAEEAFIKQDRNNRNATFFPKGELVWYSGEQTIDPGKLKLAYKFDIYAHRPVSRDIVFVDAQSGQILGKRELIHSTNATGSAVTAYSGTQTIITDNTGSIYRLRETGRGNGIQTFNMKNAGTSYSAAVDFTDSDNSWNNVNTDKDQYATDAHWGAEKTYDYFLAKYNRNSIDDAGFALKNYVHADLIAFGESSNVNAFWDGYRMTYGDGGYHNGNTINPLTALDITGHEITHGLTENTSGLIYSGESGSLNEGFSDIFGTAIEFYAKPTNANWSIGENIGEAFRSMSNPNLFNDPDTYQGTYWYTGSNESVLVHTNSGVLNYWFYLLSQGGSGTNDNGDAYNITGLGMDKAAAIAFRTNTVYLTYSSNFSDARTWAIKAAEDLYGVNSNEANQTSCAWAAVGVGTCSTSTTCNAPTGLASSSITNTSATVSWTAVSGANSYAVDYKLNSASTWTSAATATTSTSVNLTGLTTATSYNFRVRTNCSSTNSSYTQANFTTTGGSVCSTAFEPNETQSAAATIISGVTNSAAISSSSDTDYYKIVTTGSSNNLYNLVGPSGVDYDLYIYNSSGTEIGSGKGNTATESVTLNNQAAGTYYIKVIGYNGANSTSCYTIQATATAITGCQSSYDNSTNGNTSGAATIPFNTNINGLINPSGDVDNYKFVITTGGTITITLGTLPGDYDLKLLNSAGTQVGISENSSTNNETISYTAAAGTYYAQVYGYKGANSSSTCYTLKVQLGTATITGKEITQDAFKIYPNPVSSLLNVTVPGEISWQGTIKIIDAKGTIVAQQKVKNKVQTIDVSKLPSGVYLLQVNNGKENASTKFVKR